jgi:hypothetical protein
MIPRIVLLIEDYCSLRFARLWLMGNWRYLWRCGPPLGVDITDYDRRLQRLSQRRKLRVSPTNTPPNSKRHRGINVVKIIVALWDMQMRRCTPKLVLCSHIWQRFGALNRLFIVLHSLLPSCLDKFCLSEAYRKGIGCPRLVSVQVDKVIAGKIWIDYVFEKRRKKIT